MRREPPPSAKDQGRTGPPGRYNEVMKLHTARLCLNCDEVHDANECPVCNSETFTYISRWVPSPEGRPKPRPVVTPEAETYTKLLSDDLARPGAMRWVRRGAFGLAAISARAGSCAAITQSRPIARSLDAGGRRADQVLFLIFAPLAFVVLRLTFRGRWRTILLFAIVIGLAADVFFDFIVAHQARQ